MAEISTKVIDIIVRFKATIASENARFGSFEVRRGYHHGDGGIVRLVNTCGVGVALEMLLTAEPIDAQRALQANMVSRVAGHEKLMEEAEMQAAKIVMTTMIQFTPMHQNSVMKRTMTVTN